jgi:hypothetical protein
MFSRPGSALRALFHECDPAQTERLHCVIFDGLLEPATRLLEEVTTRGIARGERGPTPPTAMSVDAIPAMTMYRSKLCASEWAEQDIEDMIDQLMVPLPRRDGH